MNYTLFYRKELILTMKCIRCESEMITAKLAVETGAAPGLWFYLWNKEKGIWNSKKKTEVATSVCPECGFVELRAEKPKDLILIKK